MNVTLRQRQKGDKVSLCLDYYHQGKRQYEYLQLYLIPEPKKGKLTKEQKDENRKTLALAESIRLNDIWKFKTAFTVFRIRVK